MKKQTAVEWLIAEYINPKNQTSMASLFLEALQMEKEQIIEAHINGQTEWDITPQQDINIKFAQHYYKHTYK
jgi:hypothetical protein